MDVVCEQCKGKFKIPDEKVPKGQTFSVSCPKCKNKISIKTGTDKPAPSKEAPSPSAKPVSDAKKSIIDEVDSGSYDASEKPFDFIEEGAQTALLCEPDSDIRGKIKAALENMGYHITEPQSARDVLKQMRFHVFDMVVLNEMFGARDPDENSILKYLDRLPMSTRRSVFVALVSDRFRTTDNMAAFNKSVNLIINIKNIEEAEKVLKRGVADNAAFYRVYNEVISKNR